MTGPDDRLQRALDDAAQPPVAHDGVMDLVTHKRARRRARRRVEVGVAVGVVATVVAIAALTRGTDHTATRIKTATSGSPTSVAAETGGPHVKVLDGLPDLLPTLPGTPEHPTQLVATPENDAVTGPIGAFAGEWWVAVQPKTAGSTSPPPSDLVPVAGGSQHIGTKGAPQYFSAGDDAWWVMTRDYTVGSDNTTFRLKRVALTSRAASAPSIESIPLPFVGGQFAGGPFPTGGAVWVPARDSVTRLDASTGHVVASIPMSWLEARSVISFGGRLLVTAQTSLREIDTTTNTLTATHDIQSGIDGTPTIEGAVATPDAIWLLLSHSTGTWSVVRLDASFHTAAEIKLIAPAIGPSAISAAGNRVWVTMASGTRFDPSATDAETTTLLIDSPTAAVVKTVVVREGSSDVAWSDAGRFLFISDGKLHEVDLNK